VIDSPATAGIWDEVEHGSYVADLALWAELARGRRPVLDLGCGGGRVALALARDGNEVWALDHQPELTRALRERAAAEGLAVRTVDGDARSIALDTRFGLILAPMQLMQILDGEAGRAALLARVRAHLAPDGLFAATLVDPPLVWGDPEDDALPDVREREGWVFSSRPVCVRPEGSRLVVERLRQTVSPSGDLSEEPYTVRLDVLEPERLEAEAVAAGLTPAGRRPITPTDDHVGSVALLFSLTQPGELER
jgi:SAM-dependent methyltransferase